MRNLIVLVCIVLPALGAEAMAACAALPVQMFQDRTVVTRMAVTSGDPCGMKLRHSLGPIRSGEVARRPEHGTLSVEGTRVVYRSQKGYVGRDTFIFALRGETARGVPATYRVGVAVRVVDPKTLPKRNTTTAGNK